MLDSRILYGGLPAINRARIINERRENADHESLSHRRIHV